MLVVINITVVSNNNKFKEPSYLLFRHKYKRSSLGVENEKNTALFIKYTIYDPCYI